MAVLGGSSPNDFPVNPSNPIEGLYIGLMVGLSRGLKLAPNRAYIEGPGTIVYRFQVALTAVFRRFCGGSTVSMQ